MHRYADIDDITSRYGDDALLVVGDHNADGQVDVGRVNAALEDASEEMDTYLASRYDLPLTIVPRILKHLCVDIAMYKLSDSMDGYTEERRRRYEDAIALLRRISKGEASVGVAKTDDSQAGNHAVFIEGRGRVFSRGTMRGVK